MSQDRRYTGCNTHSNTHSAQDREKEGAVPKISGGKILPIYITGHAVLHAPAKPVTDFSGIQEIVRDMFATMFAAPGVGLAGPQIGLGLRIFVYSYTEGDTLHQGVAINPDLLIPKVFLSDRQISNRQITLLLAMSLIEKVVFHSRDINFP